jgi:hypothetical protein
MPTSAGIFPVVQALAIETKFEPLPEPSTPNRNLRLFAMGFLYKPEARIAS